ncbi:MAG: translation initiation factor IF-3 [bacterium]
MAYRFRGRDIRPTATGPPVNEAIRAPEVRVIDEEGEQLGVMPIAEALKIAEDRDYDLVEISPNADPPVCKIMDYGRYKYTQQKKANEAKKRQTTVELKEVKMRIKIDEHDYEFKKKHAERFLLDGNKAKVTIMFRGREVTHPDLGRKLLDRVANELIEISSMEQTPKLEGRNMTMVLTPKISKAQLQSAKSSQEKTSKKKSQERVQETSEDLKAPLGEAIEKAGVAPTEEAESKDEEGKEDAEA